MSTTPQAGTYVVESSTAEYDRLVGVAHTFDEHVQDGCRRAGLRRGDRVIDVGCGPLGALLSLADLVGPTGLVVGLDVDAQALEKAAAIVTRRGLSNIQLIHGDINSMVTDAIPGAGSFDLAYCRLMLVHQRDPAATLRRIGQLVKPGGRVLVQDMVFGGSLDIPASDPPFPAAARWRALVQAVMERAGASPGIAYRLGWLCTRAGLDELGQRAFFHMSGPGNAAADLEILIKTLGGVEKAILASGLATPDEVRNLTAELEVGKAIPFGYWWGFLFNELLASTSEPHAAI
jgi:ubiquinone/menaquinone biosynthesis C-methylase UbiE